MPLSKIGDVLKPKQQWHELHNPFLKGGWVLLVNSYYLPEETDKAVHLLAEQLLKEVFP